MTMEWKFLIIGLVVGAGAAWFMTRSSQGS